MTDASDKHVADEAWKVFTRDEWNGFESGMRATVDSLKAECDRLDSELELLRAENARLRRVLRREREPVVEPRPAYRWSPAL